MSSAPEEERAFLVRRLLVAGTVLLGVITVLLGAQRLGYRLAPWIPIVAGLVVHDIVRPTMPGRWSWPRAERVRFALVSGAVCSALLWGLSALLA